MNARTKLRPDLLRTQTYICLVDPAARIASISRRSSTAKKRRRKSRHLALIQINKRIHMSAELMEKLISTKPGMNVKKEWKEKRRCTKNLRQRKMRRQLLEISAHGSNRT